MLPMCRRFAPIKDRSLRMDDPIRLVSTNGAMEKVLHPYPLIEGNCTVYMCVSM
jgi:hypothetical protein